MVADQIDFRQQATFVQVDLGPRFLDIELRRDDFRIVPFGPAQDIFILFGRIKGQIGTVELFRRFTDEPLVIGSVGRDGGFGLIPRDMRACQTRFRLTHVGLCQIAELGAHAGFLKLFFKDTLIVTVARQNRLGRG